MVIFLWTFLILPPAPLRILFFDQTTGAQDGT